MYFTKHTTSNGATEYRAVVAGDHGEFAYWCQDDRSNRWPNDFSVTVDGVRFIIGYMDHEPEEIAFEKVAALDVPQLALAALVFAMSGDFDTSGDRGIEFAIS
jgi:hypothetical protein